MYNCVVRTREYSLMRATSAACKPNIASTPISTRAHINTNLATLTTTLCVPTRVDSLTSLNPPSTMVRRSRRLASGIAITVLCLPILVLAEEVPTPTPEISIPALRECDPNSIWPNGGRCAPSSVLVTYGQTSFVLVSTAEAEAVTSVASTVATEETTAIEISSRGSSTDAIATTSFTSWSALSIPSSSLTNSAMAQTSAASAARDRGSWWRRKHDGQYRGHWGGGYWFRDGIEQEAEAGEAPLKKRAAGNAIAKIPRHIQRDSSDVVNSERASLPSSRVPLNSTFARRQETTASEPATAQTAAIDALTTTVASSSNEASDQGQTIQESESVTDTSDLPVSVQATSACIKSRRITSTVTLQNTVTVIPQQSSSSEPNSIPSLPSTDSHGSHAPPPHTTDPVPLKPNVPAGGGLADEFIETDEVQCTRVVADKGAAGAGEPLTVTTSCFVYEPLSPPETSESSSLQPVPTPEATPPEPLSTSVDTATTGPSSNPAPPPGADAHETSGPSITFSAEQAQVKTAAAEGQAAIETEQWQARSSIESSSQLHDDPLSNGAARGPYVAPTVPPELLPQYASSTSSSEQFSAIQGYGQEVPHPPPESDPTRTLRTTATSTIYHTTTVTSLAFDSSEYTGPPGDSIGLLTSVEEYSTLSAASSENSASTSGPIDVLTSLRETSAMPLASLSSSATSQPAGYAASNATMFPGLLETVTYTTTICPSGAVGW